MRGRTSFPEDHMRIRSRIFGDIEIAADDVVVFPGGIPPFTELQQYCVLSAEAEPGLRWLQAVDEPSIAFAVMPPAAIAGQYDIEISDADAAELQLERAEEAELLVILAVHEQPRRVTANLRAPIVINRRRQLGKQVMLNDTQHPLQYVLRTEDEISEPSCAAAQCPCGDNGKEQR